MWINCAENPHHSRHFSLVPKVHGAENPRKKTVPNIVWLKIFWTKSGSNCARVHTLIPTVLLGCLAALVKLKSWAYTLNFGIIFGFSDLIFAFIFFTSVKIGTSSLIDINFRTFFVHFSKRKLLAKNQLKMFVENSKFPGSLIIISVACWKESDPFECSRLEN